MVRFILALSITALVVSAQEKNSMDVNTLLKNGLYHERYSGNLNHAQEYFQAALDHVDATSDIKCKARLGLAACSMKLGKKREAIKMVSQVSKDYPNRATVHKDLFDQLPELEDGAGHISKQGSSELEKRDQANKGLRSKLEHLVIPKISFADAKVTEVFQFLKEESKTLDPEKEGINFLLILRPAVYRNVERA